MAMPMAKAHGTCAEAGIEKILEIYRSSAKCLPETITAALTTPQATPTGLARTLATPCWCRTFSFVRSNPP
jgi:hypothetical protein